MCKLFFVKSVKGVPYWGGGGGGGPRKGDKAPLFPVFFNCSPKLNYIRIIFNMQWRFIKSGIKPPWEMRIGSPNISPCCFILFICSVLFLCFVLFLSLVLLPCSLRFIPFLNLSFLSPQHFFSAKPILTGSWTRQWWERKVSAGSASIFSTTLTTIWRRLRRRLTRSLQSSWTRRRTRDLQSSQRLPHPHPPNPRGPRLSPTLELGQATPPPWSQGKLIL